MVSAGRVTVSAGRVTRDCTHLSSSRTTPNGRTNVTTTHSAVEFLRGDLHAVQKYSCTRRFDGSVARGWYLLPGDVRVMGLTRLPCFSVPLWSRLQECSRGSTAESTVRWIAIVFIHGSIVACSERMWLVEVSL